MFTAKPSSMLTGEKVPLIFQLSGNSDLSQRSLCVVVVAGVRHPPVQGVKNKWGAAQANSQADVGLPNPKERNPALRFSCDDIRKKITE